MSYRLARVSPIFGWCAGLLVAHTITAPFVGAGAPLWMLGIWTLYGCLGMRAGLALRDVQSPSLVRPEQHTLGYARPGLSAIWDRELDS